MEIIEDTAIKLTVDNSIADRVFDVLENSELIQNKGDKKDILVYWGHNETSFLTSLTNKNLPSPMLRDYSWPGLYKPFDHQKTTASFLSLRRRAFCFNEAGTGKTSSVIWAADYLMELGLVKRVLIICPLSIMYSAWQADIFNTAMHRTAGVAHGNVDRRKKIINGSYDFVIINYDGVDIVREDLLDKFDLIVVDEANAYKTASTKRWKALAKTLLPSTRLWMLTGTPASQSPLDAFGLAKFINPGGVPKFYTAWRDMVMAPAGRFRWVPRPRSENLVHRALQPAIRFTKKECLDLPDVMYQTRDVPLVPSVAAYYKKLKAQMLIEAAGQSISAVNAAANLNKLLQISGGAVYTDDKSVVEFDVSPRLKALKEVLDETSNKVIIFVPYLHTIGVVGDFVKSNGYTYDCINGSVSARERAAIIDKFQQQQDPKLLIIQPQSASHGVTLTAADTIVFWSPVMSVETYIQCIGRIDRVGQRNKMTVVHLQGSEVEHKIYAMLQGKVDAHIKLVDLYKQEIGA